MIYADYRSPYGYGNYGGDTYVNPYPPKEPAEPKEKPKFGVGDEVKVTIPAKVTRVTNVGGEFVYEYEHVLRVENQAPERNVTLVKQAPKDLAEGQTFWGTEGYNEPPLGTIIKAGYEFVRLPDGWRCVTGTCKSYKWTAFTNEYTVVRLGRK